MRQILLLIAAFFAFVSFPCFAYAQNSQSSMTSEQAKFRELETSLVCFTRWGCKKHRQNAEACSTAGNFEQCMRVKEYGEDGSKTCNLDGKPNSSLLNLLQNKDLFSIPEIECWSNYIEFSLIPLGREPSFFRDMKRQLR